MRTTVVWRLNLMGGPKDRVASKPRVNTVCTGYEDVRACNQGGNAWPGTD
jgi:hypothetical protein